jgi:MoxR-like ATPase
MIYSQEKEEFTTKFGPIFTQLLLADEINRSPAKVQSALLEAMAEKQVTIGETTHPLSSPFVVLATQNPIEQEGTYPLPEAQMDRFMMKVYVDYPDMDAEKKILTLSSNPLQNLSPIMGTDDLLEMKESVAKVYVDEKVQDYIVRLIHATRPGSSEFLAEYEGVIMAGASPRASMWLYRLGQFNAYLAGKDFVSPEDVLKVIPSVLGHRVILTYEAMIDQVNARQVVTEIAKKKM